MAVLRLVLGDQLSDTTSSLRDLDPGRDVVLMAEVMAEATYAPHHKMKLALIFSAMRHFAGHLRARGITVRYVALDDPCNTGDLGSELQRAIADLAPDRVVVTACGEWRLQTQIEGWASQIPLPLEIRDDDRFLCSLARFRAWAAGKKTLRMEYFYREMRKATGLLLHPDGTPVGGQWNFDAENRQPPQPGMRFPARPATPPDAITRAVIDMVNARFAHHMGTLEGFDLAVTADEAMARAEWFLDVCLPSFGDHQDAMVHNHAFLYHAHLSAYINIGLIDPLWLCQQAEAAYHAGHAPLNAVEGFIRQILGWREYVRGIYWLHMPDYAQMNHLKAHRPLPGLYWTGQTDMACMAAAIGQTISHGYAHHIQRLMVTGNFALLAGLDVAAVCEWYLAVYIDAFEWVELPNTLGMALYADGGIMASKPYAASGKYIDRMSDYCAGCRYDPKQMTGPNACPFNALYWDFLDRNADVLSGNPRLGTMYATWRRFDDGRRAAIRAQAAQFLQSLS